MKLALVDTLHANLRSVERALEEAKAQLSAQDCSRISVVRTHDPEEVRAADGIVVPGQGGFGKCLFGLRERGLDAAILEKMRAGAPYLGICLGLQALFESSAEAEGVPGLGYFRGTCEQLLPHPGIKVPHMGWNQLNLEHGGHVVLEAAGGSGAWVYFVHSYHGVPTDRSIIKATVTHGPHVVVAAIARDNVIATQFHPEKSQRAGIQLLAGFLRL